MPSLRLTELTLVAWVKPISDERATGANCIARGNICGSADYGIGFDNSAPKIQMVGTTSNGFHYIDYFDISTSIGKWIHVVHIYEANGTWLAFINGQLKYSNNVGQIVITSGRVVGISWPNSASCGGAFNGLIANVQIYNTALTPQEIQYLYQEGLGGAPVRLQNLVAWWPLNGDAKDYSGNNNHGTIYGGVTFVQNYNPP